MTDSLSLTSAFLAGLISFLSPCVLPLVPAYLSFLAGVSLEEIRQSADHALRRRAVVSALVFVLGFSTVFVLLGATATLLGRWLTEQAYWLGKVAGAVLILLGLHLVGILKLPFLMYEKRFQVRTGALPILGVFFIGAAFAFGWSPCVGPLLAGILALAGSRETVGQGMLLLGVYSAGLGLPFVLAALAVESFLRFLRRFRDVLRWVEAAAGVLLILIGVVMMTGGMMRVASWFGVFGRFGL
ncbi:MAG: cytochrome c biogenesis protein CcdA [candidate division FCPU426 bacterium]